MMRLGRSSPSSLSSGVAVFVGLADHARALEGGQVEEQLLDLPLDHRRLLLDHQQVGQALGKFASMRVGSSG